MKSHSFINHKNGQFIYTCILRICNPKEVYAKFTILGGMIIPFKDLDHNLAFAHQHTITL